MQSIAQARVGELETVGSFDAVGLAAELREGVELLLQARQDDPEFRQQVKVSLARAHSLLQSVEGGGAVSEALRLRSGPDLRS